jgi:AAA+ ATPase superfamily predicted ATPase
MERPKDLFARHDEWNELGEFAASTRPGLRIAIVSGRRRQGKSYLLRRLCRLADGLYHQAQELERAQSLQRFADDVATRLGLARGQLQFSDWDTALRTAIGLAPRDGGEPASGAAGPSRFLVIDELPYLLAHSPELPSILQELYDETSDGTSKPSAAVILCGSALSIMTDLLSGTKPLRGPAQVDMTLKPFGFRESAQFWGVDDPKVAFGINAVLGGTPGYRSLIDAAVPRTAAGIPKWLGRSVLNPAHALFNETAYLLREDPRIVDMRLYNSILSAVAGGRHTQKEIGALLGRDANHLRHPMGILVSAGFLLREDDVLLQKRPVYFIADPVVRLSEVVLDPYRSLLEERDVDTAWERAAPAYSSLVLGPHFERMAVEWTARHSGDRWGEAVGEVGPTVVNDPDGRAQHQLDVVALPRGVTRHTPGARVVVLGEAKSSNRQRTIGDIERLEHIRALLSGRGADTGGAQLALFGREGFDSNLKRAAAERADVHLIDLRTLYTD